MYRLMKERNFMVQRFKFNQAKLYASVQLKSYLLWCFQKMFQEFLYTRLFEIFSLKKMIGKDYIRSEIQNIIKIFFYTCWVHSTVHLIYIWCIESNTCQEIWNNKHDENNILKKACRKKKQKFSLTQNLANRWCTALKTLFLHLDLGLP